MNSGRDKTPSRRGLGWLSVEDPAWLRLGRKGSTAFLAIGCLAIVGWHALNLTDVPRLDRTYSASPGFRGIYVKRLPRFFYFYHYTGKFPITSSTTREELREDRQTALEHIEPRFYPSGLRNEDYTVVRKGDLAQLFLLYPDFWRTGSTLDATPRTFNQGLALASSLFLFTGLSLAGHRLLAVLLVVLIGSHPFQLLHHYVFANVWAYPVAVASVALALSAPLVFGARPRRRHLLIPLVLGSLLATAREVRTEPALVIASVALVCATARGGWGRRALLVGTLGLSFAVTSQLWTRYWDAKFEDAVETVRAAGGKPLLSGRNLHHSLWHPIWFGLGDFGREKRYEARDKAAYAYAIPRVNARFGTKYRRSKDSYRLKNRDGSGYQLKPETIPEYQIVLREKILADITSDPLWYLGVLRQRTQRIFDRATPVRLGLGARFVDIPFSAWLVLAMLPVLLLARRWDQLKLLVFYAPTSLPALLIYSTRGFTNPTAFHLVGFALLACWGVHAATGLVTARAGRRR